MKTKDFDIRCCLHENLNKIHDLNDTLIVDELSLCQGNARVDIAVINGLMHGYEIKSESDTLERLPNQVEIYNKVFDNVTIVTGKNHLDKILSLVPDWWGIDVVENINGNISLNNSREANQNPNSDPYSIVQLLWREEALDILRMFELDKGMISKPKKKIWGKLAESLPHYELKYYVREKLKTRSNWRADRLQTLNDD